MVSARSLHNRRHDPATANADSRLVPVSVGSLESAGHRDYHVNSAGEDRSRFARPDWLDVELCERLPLGRVRHAGADRRAAARRSLQVPARRHVFLAAPWGTNLAR
jgi:hypothetical protein